MANESRYGDVATIYDQGTLVCALQSDFYFQLDVGDYMLASYLESLWCMGVSSHVGHKPQGLWSQLKYSYEGTRMVRHDTFLWRSVQRTLVFP